MIGEFFGATHDFEYNIGDKLYEFAIMSYEDFDKLKTIYTQLIELVCTAKESNTMRKNFMRKYKKILIQQSLSFMNLLITLKNYQLKNIMNI